MSDTCKHGDTACGKYYYCGHCSRERRANAYRNLTPEQKAYDRHVDPLGAYHTDFEPECSCHLSAPCSHCTREPELAASDDGDNEGEGREQK